MAIYYAHLDDITRAAMLGEWTLGYLYESPILSPVGKSLWPSLLRQAIEEGTDDSLAMRLVRESLFLEQQVYVRAGVQRLRRINHEAAAQTLAEGEFNRFYIRGLCTLAIAGAKPLVVVRGKSVSVPRPESQAKVGLHVDPTELLAHLRANDFVSLDQHLAVPSGPNSGLTVAFA